jgi:hypothetical protein
MINRIITTKRRTASDVLLRKGKVNPSTVEAGRTIGISQERAADVITINLGCQDLSSFISQLHLSASSLKLPVVAQFELTLLPRFRLTPKAFANSSPGFECSENPG